MRTVKVAAAGRLYDGSPSMGTLVDERRKGLAALVLSSLEETSKQEFGARFGFLQAREFAVPFYQSQGWKILYGIHLQL